MMPYDQQQEYLLARGLNAGIVLLWALITTGGLGLALDGLGDIAAARLFYGLSIGMAMCLLADVVFLVACVAFRENGAFTRLLRIHPLPEGGKGFLSNPLPFRERVVAQRPGEGTSSNLPKKDTHK